MTEKPVPLVCDRRQFNGLLCANYFPSLYLGDNCIKTCHNYEEFIVAILFYGNTYYCSCKIQFAAIKPMIYLHK